MTKNEVKNHNLHC